MKKRIIKTIVISLLALFMMFSSNQYASRMTMLGDINQDNIIDTRDQLLIMRHIMASARKIHPEWILTGDKLKLADITQDGRVDNSDMLRLLRYIAAKRNPEKIGKKHKEWLKIEEIDLEPDIEVESIRINKTTLSLDMSGTKTATLIATIEPDNATNKSITYTTSNTKVATVNQNGVVTAIGNGKAIITVKSSNGKMATCTVTVTTSVTSITLNKTSATLNMSGTKTVQLTATVKPNTATNKAITWSSSDKKIATVDGKGKVTAQKPGKTVTITAKTSNGKKATCKVKTTKTVKVVFKPNGGKGGGTKTYTYGTKNQKFNVTCSRKGYNFVNWNTKSNGKGKNYSYNSKVTDSWINSSSGTVTLYAIWKAKPSNFKNPLMYGQDPWVYQKDGYYYFVRSTGNGIQIFKTDRLNNLTKSGGKTVYWNGGASIWAPELHYFNNRWYIYAAIVYGSNGAASRRMYVLESTSSNPLGNYKMIGQLSTGGWAIDGTVFKYNNKLYFLWSGWPGSRDGIQNLYIAPMSSPKKISGSRILISTPSNNWERKDYPYINEGPEVLIHNGKVFIVYSVNGSWHYNYCLATLKLNGRNPLKASSWTKSNGPVFSSANGVYGPGHACFVKSPDNKEDWIVYHANTNPNTPSGDSWWANRKIFIQKFGWNSNGTPNFGKPISPSTSIKPPSGTK